jgi:hypothetical protein
VLHQFLDLTIHIGISVGRFINRPFALRLRGNEFWATRALFADNLVVVVWIRHLMEQRFILLWPNFMILQMKIALDGWA